MKKYSFNVRSNDGFARLGQIKTSNGSINTPAFMPVATQGSIKFTPIELIKEIGFDLILSNTYHLLLRPGLKVLNKFDGVSKFMKWDGPMLTDSGGFQVMSLAKFRKISKEGVKFQSHIDGSTHILTPENVVDSQNIINSNIQMSLDECLHYPVTFEDSRKSMRLSLNWAERARRRFLDTKKNKSDAQFGIIQGGIFKDLRIESIKENTDIDFDGYAIGGLAVGEGHEMMKEVVKYTAPELPSNKVRYLMGVGKPKDIIIAVENGIDIFDCVIPTREGRHGNAYTNYGVINLNNSKFNNDLSPIDEKNAYYITKNYSKSYLHHLLKINDPLGGMLVSLHNLNYYNELMNKIRNAIRDKKFNAFKENYRF